MKMYLLQTLSYPKTFYFCISLCSWTFLGICYLKYVLLFSEIFVLIFSPNFLYGGGKMCIQLLKKNEEQDNIQTCDEYHEMP